MWKFLSGLEKVIYQMKKLGFHKATIYLAELFWQATFYLVELFCRATFYLAELFRQISSPKNVRSLSIMLILHVTYKSCYAIIWILTFVVITFMSNPFIQYLFKILLRRLYRIHSVSCPLSIVNLTFKLGPTTHQS